MSLPDPDTFVPIAQGGAFATILLGFIRAIVRTTTESQLKLIEHLYSELSGREKRIRELETEVERLRDDTPQEPVALYSKAPKRK